MESGFILVKIINVIILNGVKILKGRKDRGKGKEVCVATFNPDVKCNYFTGYTKDKYPYKRQRT